MTWCLKGPRGSVQCQPCCPSTHAHVRSPPHKPLAPRSLPLRPQESLHLAHRCLDICFSEEVLLHAAV